VVLKGVLNTADADALAVAIVERQFLTQVEHPLIVEIDDFVSHTAADGSAPATSSWSTSAGSRSSRSSGPS